MFLRDKQPPSCFSCPSLSATELRAQYMSILGDLRPGTNSREGNVQNAVGFLVLFLHPLTDFMKFEPPSAGTQYSVTNVSGVGR